MSTVIITGAGGNLGVAVTKCFLEKGYKVIATAIDEEEKKNIPGHENLHAETADLTNEAGTEAFVQKAIDTYKTIDAALMLVGGFAMGDLETTKTEDIQAQITLNFETAYNLTRPLYRHMRQNNNGRLVFIGARPALQPEWGKNMIAYALSKSLLFKLADIINADAVGKNIVATVVAPSTLDTALNRKSMPDADPRNWVKPEDLAQILEFICSGKAAALRETVLKVYNNA